MPGFNLRMTVETKGLDAFPELAARIQDFTPAFTNIIDMWAKENKEKFMRGESAGPSGTTQPGGVPWQELTPSYLKSKAKRESAYPQGLMLRTGQLADTLSTRGAFAEYMSPMQAVFGTPLNQEDMDKVGYNWTKRPTVFLDTRDKLDIRRELSNYLNFGENYRDILFAVGEQRIKMREELANMQYDFGGES